MFFNRIISCSILACIATSLLSNAKETSVFSIRNSDDSATARRADSPFLLTKRAPHAAAPVPASGVLALRQATKSDILRRQSKQRARALAPRARVSGTPYPVCPDAGSNTNGVAAEYLGVVPSLNFEVLSEIDSTYPTGGACATACLSFDGCQFAVFDNSVAGCYFVAFTATPLDASSLVPTPLTNFDTIFLGVDCATEDDAFAVSAIQCCDTYTLE